MQTKTELEAIETIVVMVRGQVLHQMVVGSRQEAERYKTGVRRWAAERGMAVSIRSQGENEGQEPAATTGVRRRTYLSNPQS